MKRCFCYLLTLVLGSLAVGGLVFALLRTDVLTLTAATPTALFFFAATAAAGLGGLLAYLLGREQEAACIRLIITVKRNGLPDSIITERLRGLYCW